MSAAPNPITATNPFATRWVRPGAIPFHFPPNITLTMLLQQLAAQRGWGAIVGPHGSGKSTLLATLVDALRQAGRAVLVFELHNGERRLPQPLSALAVTAMTTVVVDGYEQLSRWQAWRLRRHVRHRGGGLLVTTHQPGPLPTLFRTMPSLEMAQQLTQELVNRHGGLVTPTDVAALYAQTQGDYRELFFALYDVHEQKSRSTR